MVKGKGVIEGYTKKGHSVQFICFVLQNKKYTNVCDKKNFESTGRQQNDHMVFQSTPSF